MKQLIVSCESSTIQAALLEGRKLVEYDAQHPIDTQRAGSIYLGRVVNVLPGMQAAFVDIGLTKNAFLYIDDVLPVHIQKQPKTKPPIGDLLTPGQKVLVQVVKDPEGSKGARITTHFSIPGRWLVYMPGAGYTAVSRKIEADEEKARLKAAADSLRSGEEGLILRTVSEGRSEEELRRDLLDLREIWALVEQRAASAAAPSCVYQDLELLPRLARDVITDDVLEIRVNDAAVCDGLRGLLKQRSPELAARVQLDDGAEPLFERFGITEELARSMRRKVWLPSGGYLVIDPTEALTVIDVNTGRYTGTSSLEQTVFRTNLEAAAEIPRLLRLRNLRGIIIVDFIDMELPSHRERVLETMTEAVKKDRSKTVLLGWTKLGLLEITRKRK
ncbi:Rne/Rng family ribonuclease [Paenibacillus lutrae]|uniref:Rne/Rng family ribonuclease n=1 Tax=Paenibacillus lutrae TaxID=2078573 RepID=A0A7X3JZ76_9BACL|nr:Rne/Rng family ribonuclease [Paenibacillus lutrae]MVO99675.1 Rne/Rng family ribonuclease [Paenibacillus lutrae]